MSKDLFRKEVFDIQKVNWTGRINSLIQSINKVNFLITVLLYCFILYLLVISILIFPFFD